MSYPGATYAPAFYADAYAADGYAYRFHLDLLGFGGSAVDLTGSLVGAQMRMMIDAGGSPTGLFAPLAPSVLEITLAERLGRFGALTAAPDGAVRLRVYRRGATGVPGEGATYTIRHWTGYLFQQDVIEAPAGGLPLVTLGFYDGLGLSAARPFAGTEADAAAFTSDPERLATSVARVINALAGDTTTNGAWAGLSSVVNWRPFLPSQIASTKDPLWAVKSLEEAWLDEDGISLDEREALRLIASRLNARLFQSNGRWWFVQPDALAAAPTAVPVSAYNVSGASIPTGTSPTPTATDLLVDVVPGTWDVGVPERLIADPVKSISSHYDFHPDLDTIILNGSFEVAGSAADEAEHWTLTGDAERALISGLLTTYAGDEYAMRLVGHLSAGTPARAQQSGLFYLPPAAGWEFALQWNVGWELWDEVIDPGGIRVRLGSYYLEEGTLTAGAGAWQGAKGGIYLSEPLADGGLVGTPVIPKGAVLHFFRTGTPGYITFQLSEEARVGDEIIYGTLDDDIEEGDYARFFAWQLIASQYLFGVGAFESTTGPGGSSAIGTRRAFATGYALSGERVSGYLDIDIKGPETDEGFVPVAYYDDVRAAITAGAAEARGLAYIAASSGDTPGLIESLPVFNNPNILGDGPLPTSETALWAEGASAVNFPSQQGEDTGWKVGTYGGAEASTEEPIDALAARRALQMTAGPNERWMGTIYPKGGQAIYPHQVYRLYQWSALKEAVTVGASTILMYAPPQVGQPLILSPGTADEETVTVATVTATTTYHTVTITGTTANAHAEEAEVMYGILAWWESYTHDILLGAVTISAVRLQLADDSAFTSALTYEFEDEGGGRTRGGIGTVGSGSGGGGGGDVPTTLEHEFLSSGGFSFSPSVINHAGDTTVTLTPPQDLRTTASPTFDTPTVGQLTLLNAGTGTDRAVRADRTLQITTGNGLTGGGGAVNLTANRSWTLGLTGQALRLHNVATNGLFVRASASSVVARSMATGSPNSVTWANASGAGGNPSISLAQDIHTGATPQFARLGLGAAAHGTHKLYVNGTSSFEDDLTSPTFVSGFGGEGFRIQRDTAGGKGANHWEGTFDELWVRGRMHVYELIIQQIRATNGSVLVANAAKVKTATQVGIGSYDLTFDLDYTVFAVNDILLAQRFEQTGAGQATVYQSFVRVTAISGTTVTVLLLSSSDPPESGFDYVRIGNTTDADRQGSVYLTADDQDAPYVDVRDGVDSVAAWGGGASKLRMGRLDGITDPAFGSLSGYGLWTDSAYLTGTVWAQAGIFGTGTYKWEVSGEEVRNFTDASVALRIHAAPSANAGNHYARDDAHTRGFQVQIEGVGHLSMGEIWTTAAGVPSVASASNQGWVGLQYLTAGAACPFQLGVKAADGSEYHKIAAFRFDTTTLTGTVSDRSLALDAGAAEIRLAVASEDRVVIGAEGFAAADNYVELVTDDAEATFDLYLNSADTYFEGWNLGTSGIALGASQRVEIAFDWRLNEFTENVLATIDVTIQFRWSTFVLQNVTYRFQRGLPEDEWQTFRLVVPIDETHGGPAPSVKHISLQAVDTSGGSPGTYDWNATIRNFRVKGVWPKVSACAEGVRVYSSPDYYTELGLDGARVTGDIDVAGRLYLGAAGGAFEITGEGPFYISPGGTRYPLTLGTGVPPSGGGGGIG